MLLRLLMFVVFCGVLDARSVAVQSVNADDATVARLTAQVEPAFEHVETKTGLRDDEDLQLVVVSGARSFADIAGKDGVSMHAESVLGYAMPGRRRLVLNLTAIRERNLEPVGVLRHEVAHLVMGSALRTQRPLWFEEGVAQYVESVAVNELREAGGASPWISFDSLDDLSTSLRHETRAGPAYSEVREVVRLIINRHGEGALFKLMDELAAGVEFATAFEAATGEDLAAFERAWQDDFESRSAARFGGFFGANLWWILLGLTGLLVPLVFLLRRSRGKAQVDQWEEIEKHFPSDPSWSYAEDEYEPQDPDAWKK